MMIPDSQPVCTKCNPPAVRLFRTPSHGRRVGAFEIYNSRVSDVQSNSQFPAVGPGERLLSEHAPQGRSLGRCPNRRWRVDQRGPTGHGARFSPYRLKCMCLAWRQVQPWLSLSRGFQGPRRGGSVGRRHNGPRPEGHGSAGRRSTDTGPPFGSEHQGRRQLARGRRQGVHGRLTGYEDVNPPAAERAFAHRPCDEPSYWWPGDQCYGGGSAASSAGPPPADFACHSEALTS